MTVDARAVAIRFADLWAVDPHQMVDEIYADDIVMENMANPARVVLGSAQLHAVEDELAARIPEHRHELIRVIADEDVVCLETTVVAPLSHEYAPACVWWWLDETGKVAAEVGWFDWTDRSTDSRRAHGTVPPSLGVGGPRVASWYARMAEEYVRRWSHDPLGSALEMFATCCTFGHVGGIESRGVEELARTRQLLFDELPAPGRQMQLHRLVGDGSALAMLVTIGDTTRVTRGTVVLTFDSNDLIVSERTYCDWSKAMPRAEPGQRPMVGSADWTPSW
ncbi:MAG: nuclear transport factor 2 family protein [Actinomycetota bacterium]|nr:nuclear transport factor 2 family protein [Actinomycetota bacterium]